MSAFLVILTIAIVLLVLLLLLPIDFTGRGLWGGDKYFEAGLKWAGGLVALSFKVPGPSPVAFRFIGLTLWRGGNKGKSSPQAKSAKKAKRVINWRWARVLGNRELFRAGMAFLRRLVKDLRLEVRLDGRYDLGDPALNGVAAGLQAMLGGNQLKLYARPNFTQDGSEFTCCLQGRVIPAEMLALGIIFFWQKPVRRVWLATIKNKISIKKGAIKGV
ncbi:MAG: hypothetical protein GX949_06585 [Peptococcaceae bacterium]|nr:hypothetical protein [Peptococcaceae bacterium]